MTEQDLRALVRDAIARELARRGQAAGPASPAVQAPAPASVVSMHLSHAVFPVPSGAETDGPCVIEPAVGCNHCGYCKSYGH